eukprot:m.283980 g.283980  ORF g.283980 m.283980 type:complete len:235 (-) comp19894_c0_seq1:1659-2363(-)
MGLEMMFGCLFITMTLPVSVFFFSVAHSAKLIILMFGAAFVWLVSSLLASIIWIAVVPLKDDVWFSLIFAVGLQELFRYLYWKLLKKAEVGLQALGDDGDTRDRQAMVAGVGFSLMSTVMQANQILEEAAGPGSLPAQGCEQHSLYTISSITIACFGAFNIFWSLIMYSGLEQMRSGAKSGVHKVLFVVASHYFATFLTLNNKNGGPCSGTLVPLYLVMVLTGAYTWRICGMSK